MYFIAERQDDKELPQLPLELRFKGLILNLYILGFIVLDLAFLKRKAYEVGTYNLNGVISMSAFFVLSQIYGFYAYFTSKQKIRSDQISWIGTFFWHLISLVKTVLFGFSLSNAKHQYFSVYFMVRFTIYASTFFLILSHLRVVRKFVLRKDEYKTVQNRHLLWQLGNFNKVFYASLLGNSVDVIAFGNDFNYYCWLSMMSIWGLYEFKTIMAENYRWKYLRNIFQSE